MTLFHTQSYLNRAATLISDKTDRCINIFLWTPTSCHPHPEHMDFVTILHLSKTNVTFRICLRHVTAVGKYVLGWNLSSINYVTEEKKALKQI